MKIKRNIYLRYGISLLQGMVFYGPIATLYRQAAGVTVFEITLIESISLALCIALEMPWGVVADRIGYKNTLVISSLIYVVSKVVFWKADGFGGFLLERVMLSVVMAGMSGCDVSLLYLSCREGESHQVFGVYNLLNTAGLLAAALIFSVAIGDDYRMAGFLTVLTYAAAAALAFGLKEVKEKEDRKPVKGRFLTCLKEVVSDKRFLLLLVGMAFLAETNQTITVFLNQLKYEACGIAPANRKRNGRSLFGRIYEENRYETVCPSFIWCSLRLLCDTGPDRKRCACGGRRCAASPVGQPFRAASDGDTEPPCKGGRPRHRFKHLRSFVGGNGNRHQSAVRRGGPGRPSGRYVLRGRNVRAWRRIFLNLAPYCKIR